MRNVLLYETRGGTLLENIRIPPVATHQDGPMSVAFSPNGKSLAVGTRSGKVHYFDLPSGSLRQSFAAYPEVFGAGCASVTFSPDGRFLVTGRRPVKGADIGLIRVWRVSDGKMLIAYSGTIGSIRTLSWNPKNDILAAGDDASLRLWKVGENTQTPVLMQKISHGSYCTAFSAEGMLAATDNSKVVIYKLQ